MITKNLVEKFMGSPVAIALRIPLIMLSVNPKSIEVPPLTGTHLTVHSVRGAGQEIVITDVLEYAVITAADESSLVVQWTAPAQEGQRQPSGLAQVETILSYGDITAITRAIRVTLKTSPIITPG